MEAAVGDIGIVADRYEIADFSQPYLDTGIVMVVKVKPDVTNTRLMVFKAFELKMWMLMAALSVFTGVGIWLNEYANNNPEFRGPLPQNIGSMLWFSVTILSFVQSKFHPLTIQSKDKIFNSDCPKFHQHLFHDLQENLSKAICQGWY